MSWATVIINLLRFLTLITTQLRERKLIQQGRDGANAENLAAAMRDLAIAHQVLSDLKGVTDAEVDRQLEAKGWMREE